MRAVVQRVTRASVTVDGETVGAIDRGLLVYLGVGRGDGPEDRAWTLGKIAGLRVFADADGKMSLDVGQVGGAILVVSQFTLYGDLRRGRRPSFDDAMPPAEARAEYDASVAALRAMGHRVETGRFAAHMVVASDNDGPVTIWLDSRTRG